MSLIRAGHVTVFFLFDLAEGIDLQKVQSLIASASPTVLTPKPTTPSYIQYQHPPVTIDGRAVGAPSFEGFHVRFKAFDYGVVSLALTRQLPESWPELLAQGLKWHDDRKLAAGAESLCRQFVDRVRPAMTALHDEVVTEDYLIYTVTSLDDVETAEALLAAHGADIAQLLRGERDLLSTQEREEVLRNRISYLANDLVVPTWNAAFVYDTESGAQAALEILEFANSQLLEFRYYDGLLDARLARIYAQLQVESPLNSWLGRRYNRAARQVHALFIDVNELTDKTENALKIAGDIYAARLFALAGARLGLDHWKANVREKLKTLDDIYRFAVEQTAMARGELLEMTIVAILVFELILFFMGIMR